MKNVFSCFDADCLGVLSYAELVNGLVVLTNSTTGDKVAVSFLVLDTNSSGAISVDEVEVFIKSVLKILVLCCPTARDQLLRNCNASDRYPSVLVVNSSPGESGEFLDETEMENLIIVVENIAKDVVQLCYNSGFIEKSDSYECVDIDLLCRLVGEFCDMQQTIADHFYV